jgi:hypothetical protein
MGRVALERGNTQVSVRASCWGRRRNCRVCRVNVWGCGRFEGFSARCFRLRRKSTRAIIRFGICMSSAAELSPGGGFRLELPDTSRLPVTNIAAGRSVTRPDQGTSRRSAQSGPYASQIAVSGQLPDYSRGGINPSSVRVAIHQEPSLGSSRKCHIEDYGRFALVPSLTCAKSRARPLSKIRGAMVILRRKVARPSALRPIRHARNLAKRRRSKGALLLL